MPSIHDDIEIGTVILTDHDFDLLRERGHIVAYVEQEDKSNPDTYIMLRYTTSEELYAMAVDG